MEYRIETDFLGEMKIPFDAYYGIHAKRAVENFPIADVAISVYPKYSYSLCNGQASLRSSK